MKGKSQKGITLVALIITIIILLILAVVAIQSVNGDGIIQRAKDAADGYTIAQEKENVYLAANQAFLMGNGKIILDNLTSALEAQIGDQGDKWEYSDTTNPTEWVKVKIPPASPDGREYKIYMNGKVEDTLGGDLGGDEPQIGAVANLKLGDYINYNGSTWVVFYNDDTNGLQIIPQNLTTAVNLYGINGNNQSNISYGYENQVTYSKQVCASFIKSNLGAIDCRAVGGQHGYNNKAYLNKEIYKMEISDGSIVTVEAESTEGYDANLADSDGNNLVTVISKLQLPNYIWCPGPSRYISFEEDNETVNSDGQLGTGIFNTSTLQIQHVNLLIYDIDTKTLTEQALINDEVTNVVIVPSVLLDKRITITGGTGETIDSAYTYTFAN